MKKLIAVIGFVVILGIVTIVGTNVLHNEKNQQYIENIFHKDAEVNNKLGSIKSYKISKVGRFSGSPDESANDYYILNVVGEKKSGVIYLRIYKDKENKIQGYKIEIDE
ncbi:hypothetical protein Q5X54_05140 [Acinetobacter baumannii]|nr:hypothetical protein [Acinetobacter baumannii]MDV7488078.1 hypothetical protein [Acinetobacter baumannii]